PLGCVRLRPAARRPPAHDPGAAKRPGGRRQAGRQRASRDPRTRWHRAAAHLCVHGPRRRGPRLGVLAPPGEDQLAPVVSRVDRRFRRPGSGRAPAQGARRRRSAGTGGLSVSAVQLSSLETGPSLPEGFEYREDFVSGAEETELVSHIARLELREFEFHGYFGKRRVTSFGLRYDFNDMAVHEAAEIPDSLLSGRDRAPNSAALCRPPSRMRLSPNIRLARRSAGTAIGRFSAM